MGSSGSSLVKRSVAFFAPGLEGWNVTSTESDSPGVRANGAAPPVTAKWLESAPTRAVPVTESVAVPGFVTSNDRGAAVPTRALP